MLPVDDIRSGNQSQDRDRFGQPAFTVSPRSLRRSLFLLNERSVICQSTNQTRMCVLEWAKLVSIAAGHRSCSVMAALVLVILG